MSLHRLPWFLLLLACPAAAQDDTSTAETLSKLATDPAQAELWAQVAATGSAPGLTQLTITGSPVATHAQLKVPETAVESRTEPFPEDVATAVTVVASPPLEEGFTGKGQLKAVEGEFLTLDLGLSSAVQLQVKAGGRPLPLEAGQPVEVGLQLPEPPNMAMLLTLTTAQQRFGLVSGVGGGPVQLQLPGLGVTALQGEDGRSVQVTVGETTQRAVEGQTTLDFGDVTVEVLGSVVLPKTSAGVVPGPPYRLEIAAWSTSAQ